MKRDFALPGSQAQYAPDRRFDIQHYRIDLHLDPDAARIEGSCTITFTPLAADERWLRLDAVELDISRVRRGDARLEFYADGKTVRIDLGAAPAPGETVELAIDYGGAPRRGLYFIGPDEHYPDKPRQVWSQGQDQDSRYWFPCFDSPHEKATSEVIARVPSSWFALSNGSLISDETEGDERRLHWRFDLPHSCYLITLAAGELVEIEDRWRDIDVSYYCRPGFEDACKRTLGRTPEMLELLSGRYGVEYPYEKYAQVFVADFIFGGMENTTATTLTDVVLLDERAALDYDVEALVAHELAHQWFGNLLTCRDWGHGWLNEGFATYAEYLWREHAEGRDAAAMELEDWGQQYFGEDSGRYRRTVATNVYDEPIDVFDHHLYEKGGRVLHMLRRVLGDDAFWRSIAHYLRKHRSGTVETRDLARAVEDATGRVLDWFFDQWILEGTGHPELSVSYAWEPERKLARVKVEQTQDTKGDTPLFRLPTQLRFRVGDDDIDVDIEITEAQQTFFVPLEREPSQAIFDPGKHMLAQIKMDKAHPLWTAELTSATHGIDRIDAARALAKTGGARAEAALLTALAKDAFWGVQAEAAAALGNLRTSGARDGLIAALSTEHPKARRGVVKALGQFAYDEQAAAALARVVEAGDASYFVEAEACLALGKTRAARAAELLRGVLDRDSFMDVIRQHAYRGLAEARDPTAIPLLLSASEYGRISHGRRAAIGALAQLARGSRDRDARDARERIEGYLRDPDFRVQAAAIDALGAIGDPASKGALQQTVDRELDGRLRRRSREVLRDLSESRSRDEQLEALRSELDQLRSQSAAMRARLDQLDAAAEPARTATKVGGKPAAAMPATVRRRGGGKKRPRQS